MTTMQRYRLEADGEHRRRDPGEHNQHYWNLQRETTLGYAGEATLYRTSRGGLSGQLADCAVGARCWCRLRTERKRASSSVSPALTHRLPASSLGDFAGND